MSLLPLGFWLHGPAIAAPLSLTLPSLDLDPSKPLVSLLDSIYPKALVYECNVESFVLKQSFYLSKIETLTNPSDFINPN